MSEILFDKYGEEKNLTPLTGECCKRIMAISNPAGYFINLGMEG